MKTIEINLYKFSELNKEAQQDAINKLSDINVSFEWWKSTLEDAKQIGLKINTFDLNRNKGAEGEIIETVLECIDKIKANHGENTDTYLLALKFEAQYNAEFTKFEDINKPIYVKEDKEQDFDDFLADFEHEFKDDLLDCYADIIQNEYDYLLSDEAIIETIEANDYDFTKEGKLY